MPRLSNKTIIESIQNGEQEVMLYVTRKYFQSVRRILRRKGFKDADTPSIFADILVALSRDIQMNKLSPGNDFDKLLFNYVDQYISSTKEQHNRQLLPEEKDKLIAADCYSILDSDSKKILAERYVHLNSFEQIAARLNFSNPLIAEFEFNKAFTLFKNVVQARLSAGDN